MENLELTQARPSTPPREVRGPEPHRKYCRKLGRFSYLCCLRERGASRVKVRAPVP